MFRNGSLASLINKNSIVKYTDALNLKQSSISQGFTRFAPECV